MSNCLIRHMRPQCECGETCAIQEIIEDDLADVLAEIERLRSLLDSVEQDAAEWVEERTKRLRADNERLRAALTRLVSWAGPVELACPELGGLLKAMYDARSALEGKDG